MEQMFVYKTGFTPGNFSHAFYFILFASHFTRMGGGGGDLSRKKKQFLI